MYINAWVCVCGARMCVCARHLLLLLLRVLQSVFRVAAQLEDSGMPLSFSTCEEAVDLHETFVSKENTTPCFNLLIKVPIHAR